MAARMGLLEHFRKLASFRGREDRASFWPYAAMVLGILTVAGSLMLIPAARATIQAMRDRTLQEPWEVNWAADLSEYSPPMRPQAPGLTASAGLLGAYLAATLALAVLLYAAAVVRRLHDRGMSGAWGLMPLPFLAFTSIQTVRLFGSMGRGERTDVTSFFAVALGNILYWAALLALIVLLAGASEPGRNSYDVEE